MSILVSLLINAAALWVAIRLVEGVTFTGTGPALFGVAIVFGVLNAVLRPILKFFTFPFFIVTLGLFTFVLNAVMLLITSAVSEEMKLGFHVSGFAPAFFGALAVTIVSFALSLFTGSSDDKKKDK